MDLQRFALFLWIRITVGFESLYIHGLYNNWTTLFDIREDGLTVNSFKTIKFVAFLTIEFIY